MQSPSNPPPQLSVQAQQSESEESSEEVEIFFNFDSNSEANLVNITNFLMAASTGSNEIEDPTKIEEGGLHLGKISQAKA